MTQVIGANTGGGGGVNSVTESATIYVSTDGNNANNGLSWATAKLTIPAAIGALPLAADAIARNGTVEIGYGTFTVNSSSRVDSCTTTNGSPTIGDTSITANDDGAFVFSAGIAAGAQIVSVVPGVSFTIQSSLHANTTATQPVTIVQPAINLPTGVKLRGRGRWNGQVSGASTNYPTLIQDNGTGITIAGPSGTGPLRQTTPSTMRCVLEDLCVLGNSGNLYGFYAANLWGLNIEGCLFQNHGQWGIYLDKNVAVGGAIEDSYCFNNGTATATIPTGGIQAVSTPDMFLLKNVRCNYNFGCAYLIGGGMQMDSCDASETQASLWIPAGGPGSGIGIVTQGGADSGNITVIDTWLEQATAGGNSGTLVFHAGNLHLLLDGCTLQCDNILNYAIWNATASPGSLSLKRTSIVSPVQGCIRTKNTWTAPIFWEACDVFVNSTPPANGFIFNSDSGLVIPTTAMPGLGRYLANSTTTPGASSTITLTSGTAWQNTTGSDVDVYVPITWTAGGSVAVANGTSSTPPTLYTDLRGSAGTGVVKERVRAQSYFEVTLTSASFTVGASNNATIQPV